MVWRSAPASRRCVAKMDGFFEVRALGGSVTGVPNRFRVDGVVSSMPTVTGEEPVAGFSPQPMPVFAQFLE